MNRIRLDEMRRDRERRSGRGPRAAHRSDGEAEGDGDVPPILRLVGGTQARPGVPEALRFQFRGKGELILDVLTAAQWERLGDDRWDDFYLIEGRNQYVRWRIVQDAD